MSPELHYCTDSNTSSLFPLLPGWSWVLGMNSHVLRNLTPLLVSALSAHVPQVRVSVEGVPDVGDVGVVSVGHQEGVDQVVVGAVLVGHAPGCQGQAGPHSLVRTASPDSHHSTWDHCSHHPGLLIVSPQETLAQLHSSHPAHCSQREWYGVECEPGNLSSPVLDLRNMPEILIVSQ